MDSRLQRGISLAKTGETREAIALLESIESDAERAKDAATASDALDWLGWLAWVELDGEQARRCAAALMRLDLPKASREAFRVFIRQATVTLQAGDARGAARLLEEAENAGDLADIDAFGDYLMVKGDVCGALGENENAIHHTRLGVEIARNRRDRYSLWRRLLYHAYSLAAGGRVRWAGAALDEALQVAEDESLTWERTFTLARAAFVAFTLGDMRRARTLIGEAFAATEPHRWAYVQRSMVGVAIGLATGDGALLSMAFDEDVPRYAFESADAYTIGYTAAAYHAYFRRAGREDAADDLLHRALDRLPSPDCGWWLVEAAAEYGNDSEVERTERLIAMFPKNHPLASAYRALFEARIAVRRGDRSRGELRAGEAQALFEQCEWLFMAARAAEYAGRLGDAKSRYSAMGATAEASRLAGQRARPGRPRSGYESTRQRREIVELIAKGATNRVIAERLGVSPRTVKYRISELYADEGVASRDELLASIRSGRTLA
ncbi:MAG TPA: helix-turn-helix domain-containing protein [Verrucomicrobiae bacterium]|nr:helix-turn-helix domain-containing protein [Verrucomicrobiae bacterium]